MVVILHKVTTLSRPLQLYLFLIMFVLHVLTFDFYSLLFVTVCHHYNFTFYFGAANVCELWLSVNHL